MLYLECENVEKALLQHAQDSLEDKYVAAITDECANLITIDTPAALEYLFYAFGKVTSEEVAQKEAEIMTIA